MQFERECSLHRQGQPEYGQVMLSSTSDSMWQCEMNKQILFNLMHQSFVSTAPPPPLNNSIRTTGLRCFNGNTF